MLRVSATAPNTASLGAAALRKTVKRNSVERRSAQTIRSEGRSTHVKINVYGLKHDKIVK